jgi:hypothetical protein
MQLDQVKGKYVGALRVVTELKGRIARRNCMRFESLLPERRVTKMKCRKKVSKAPGRSHN